MREASAELTDIIVSSITELSQLSTKRFPIYKTFIKPKYVHPLDMDSKLATTKAIQDFQNQILRIRSQFEMDLNVRLQLYKK